MSFRWRVVVDVPALGLRTGDLIDYDPANLEEPYVIVRGAKLDPGAILNQANIGTIAQIDISPSSGVRRVPTPSFPSDSGPHARVLRLPSAS